MMAVLRDYCRRAHAAHFLHEVYKHAPINSLHCARTRVHTHSVRAYTEMRSQTPNCGYFYKERNKYRTAAMDKYLIF